MAKDDQKHEDNVIAALRAGGKDLIADRIADVRAATSIPWLTILQQLITMEEQAFLAWLNGLLNPP